MNIPSFEQFLSDMGPNFLTNANERALGDKVAISSPADTISAATMIAIEVLAAYHAWLVSQLSD